MISGFAWPHPASGSYAPSVMTLARFNTRTRCREPARHVFSHLGRLTAGGEECTIVRHNTYVSKCF